MPKERELSENEAFAKYRENQRRPKGMRGVLINGKPMVPSGASREKPGSIPRRPTRTLTE